MLHILQWHTPMLEVCVPNVSSETDVCCKCVYLDATYVSHICCRCFIWMLLMFCNDFSCVFGYFCKCVQTHVSSVPSVYRYMLQMFYLHVSKVDRGVALVAMRAGGCRRALPPTSRGTPCPLLSSPPFPSLHLASALALTLG
jgi:hypothetical protein